MIPLPPSPFLPKEPPPPSHTQFNSLYTLEPIVNLHANLKLLVLQF